MFKITRKEYDLRYDHWDGVRSKIVYVGKIRNFDFCITRRRMRSWKVCYQVGVYEEGFFNPERFCQGKSFFGDFQHLKQARCYITCMLKNEA